MSMPIVLLSGTLCDEQLWEQVIRRLDPSNIVIVKSLGSHQYWEKEVVHLVEGLPEEFTLAGFSLGGIAALAILNKYPKRVKRLVLVASTALADPNTSQVRRRELFQKAEDNQEMTECALKQISLIDEANLGSGGVQFVIDMANRLSMKQYYCQTELACTREDTLSMLSLSSIPIHLIYGSEDQACGKDKQDLITDCCTASLYEVKEGGHWLPLTHSGFVASVINSQNTEILL